MRINAVIALLLTLLTCGFVVGQQSRVQFPQPLNTTPPGFTSPPSFGGGFTPQPPPGAYLGGTIQPFDPYALPGNMGAPGATGFGAPNFGGLAPPPSFPPGTLSTPPPGFNPNWQPPGTIGSPGTLPPFPGTAPGATAIPPGFGSPGFGSPYGQPTPPTRPPSVGDPFGMGQDPYFRGSPYATSQTSSMFSQTQGGPPYARLFQDTGLRATYLYGKDRNDLQMTEVEASTTLFCANFLGLPNGLRVTPGFAFHWTDGPQGPPHVPAQLYSGYLDFGIEPRFNAYASAELSARVGIYSDFQAVNQDSIRFLGTAVGVFQTTPNTALKLGVAYIDRLDVKLLPAGGILWTPNQHTRWDIFFPAPKLSNYWATMGNQQVWWYLAGEYGGGSWTVEGSHRRHGNAPITTLLPSNDRMDINDIRVYLGVEWWNVNRYYGFLELGYVFNRELVYYRVPSASRSVDDTFMLRGGISW